MDDREPIMASEDVGNFALENHQIPMVYYALGAADPAKLAAAMIELVDAQTPPLRLPLGTDTLKAIADKNAYVAQETETWKALSASTDFND